MMQLYDQEVFGIQGFSDSPLFIGYVLQGHFPIKNLEVSFCITLTDKKAWVYPKKNIVLKFKDGS